MTARSKVLVADDEQGWRELLEHWLKGAGYDVRVSSDGKGVLPLASRFRPGCFILDHDLGDTTGYNVCTALKTHPEHRGTPVILLTANVDLFPKIAADCAADHFLAKNENPDELLLLLGELLPPAGAGR